MFKEDVSQELKNKFPEAFLKIGVVGKSVYFTPYRDALVEAIKTFGFEAKGFDYIDYDYQPDGFIIINPFQYNNKFNYHKYMYAGLQTEQVLNNEVYNVEMGLHNYKKLKKIINKYDFIFEWSPAAYRALNNKYNNIYFLPHSNFTSMRYLEKYENDNIQEKYDLLFVGWATGINNRRSRILELLSEKYHIYPKYENLWGDEKERAILSSKICLNLHFDNSLVYESPRMYEYLANKKFVLSEKISDSYPFIEGQDYDYFYIHNMFEKIDYYLSNTEERQRIAINGFNAANRQMLNDNIRIILERFLLEKWIRKSFKWQTKKTFFHIIGLRHKTF